LAASSRLSGTVTTGQAADELAETACALTGAGGAHVSLPDELGAPIWANANEARAPAARGTVTFHVAADGPDLVESLTAGRDLFVADGLAVDALRRPLRARLGTAALWFIPCWTWGCSCSGGPSPVRHRPPSPGTGVASSPARPGPASSDRHDQPAGPVPHRPADRVGQPSGASAGTPVPGARWRSVDGGPGPRHAGQRHPRPGPARPRPRRRRIRGRAGQDRTAGSGAPSAPHDAVVACAPVSDGPGVGPGGRVAGRPAPGGLPASWAPRVWKSSRSRRVRSWPGRLLSSTGRPVTRPRGRPSSCAVAEAAEAGRGPVFVAGSCRRLLVPPLLESVCLRRCTW
jgi:hypothetical protein